MAEYIVLTLIVAGVVRYVIVRKDPPEKTFQDVQREEMYTGDNTRSTK